MPGRWLGVLRPVRNVPAHPWQGRRLVAALAGALTGVVVLALVLWQVVLPTVVARFLPESAADAAAPVFAARRPAGRPRDIQLPTILEQHEDALTVGFSQGLVRLAPTEVARALTFALDLPVDDAGNVQVFATRLDLEARRVAWAVGSPNPSCCAFPVLVATPDGSTILVGSDAIYLLDSEGRVVRREAALAEGEAALGGALSADGRRAVVTTSEGRVLGLERERTGLAWTLNTKQPEVAAALSRDGRVIVIATPNEVRLAAWAAGEPRTIERRPLPFRSSWIAVGIDATGERYAAVGLPLAGEAQAYLYAQGHTTPLAEATIPGARLPEITLTPDGALAVVTSTWVPGAGAIVPAAGTPVIVPVDPAGGLVSLAASVQGDRVAMLQGRRLQVLRWPGGDVLWDRDLDVPGQAVTFAGDWVVITGSATGSSVLTDRLWAWQVPVNAPAVAGSARS
jgi:hypothetical protein